MRIQPYSPYPGEDDAYGGSIPSFATIGVASVAILRPRFNRRAVVLVNDSGNNIYLSKVNPAIVGSGIRLNANGGNYSEPDLAGRIWRGGWFAISGGAGNNLSITEDF